MLNEQGDRIKGGQSSFAKQHTESRQACHPPRHPRYLASMWHHDAGMARERRQHNQVPEGQTRVNPFDRRH